VKGIIIEGYGPGNLPVSDDFLVDAFIEAAEKEIIIVAIS
jgi:L-asparaginase/Glu-tRNA(Gln) amidotransferase subunit D